MYSSDVCCYATEKTGLTYIHKHTCWYYGTYLLFCMCYANSVSFIEFRMESYIYSEPFVTVVTKD